jgi:hypothetical protein
MIKPMIPAVSNLSTVTAVTLYADHLLGEAWMDIRK